MNIYLMLAIILLIVIFMFWYYTNKKFEYKLSQTEKKNAHELAMKILSLKQEQIWHTQAELDKENDLELKKKEFEELTLQQKLLDKVLDKKLDDKIQDMGKELDALKKQFESLNGEIEQIIIKKK